MSGIIKEGDWIINHKGMIRKVVKDRKHGHFMCEGGDPALVNHNWPATIEDAFRLAKLPKPPGSILVQAFGEIVALRDDGVKFKEQQEVLTRFRIKTIPTVVPLTVWVEDGTFGRLNVIDISRLPLSDAIGALPSCVLSYLEPATAHDVATRRGGSAIEDCPKPNEDEL